MYFVEEPRLLDGLPSLETELTSLDDDELPPDGRCHDRQGLIAASTNSNAGKKTPGGASIWWSHLRLLFNIRVCAVGVLFGLGFVMVEEVNPLATLINLHIS